MIDWFFDDARHMLFTEALEAAYVAGAPVVKAREGSPVKCARARTGSTAVDTRPKCGGGYRSRGVWRSQNALRSSATSVAR